ncbi:hypothetical protein RYZ26_06065 [Terasakiella sp. A23]|uniref:hypothetical protein n=1 Tax=Terasakiella sp. FCG-A23 TaxID=3080561 RepID=UPI002952F8BB|nr:hypothetical protein [Terasakiella sp. A23]MDV7339148.1 hypothetical protein [Terasakiella sp. A23]
MKIAYLLALLIGFAASPLWASDIAAPVPLTSKKIAEQTCPQTCQQHECGWSGQFKKGSCDCGSTRIIKIPGGVIRTQEQAVAACTEICTLNEAPWTGQWEHFKGGFDLCSCQTVGDWCEPKQVQK